MINRSADSIFDTGGIYNVGSAGAAATYNVPYNYGCLMVFGGMDTDTSYFVQLFVERAAGTYKVYIRTGTKDAGYYDWRVLATTVNV